MSRYLSVVRMSRGTWARRRQAGPLSHEESDRAANLIRAHAKALEYFDGNEDAARRWMKLPAPAFDGETPLGRCDIRPRGSRSRTTSSEWELRKSSTYWSDSSTVSRLDARVDHASVAVGTTRSAWIPG